MSSILHVLVTFWLNYIRSRKVGCSVNSRMSVGTLCSKHTISIQYQFYRLLMCLHAQYILLVSTFEILNSVEPRLSECSNEPAQILGSASQTLDRLVQRWTSSETAPEHFISLRRYTWFYLYWLLNNSEINLF